MEPIITIHDLKVIVINLIDTHNEVHVKLRDDDDFKCLFFICDFEYDKSIVTVSENINAQRIIQFSIADIEIMEFDSFYKYKGKQQKF